MKQSADALTNEVRKMTTAIENIAKFLQQLKG